MSWYNDSMPRPLRLEYEGAYYHVMNRGRQRQTIFHDACYFQAFLDTLSETHQRFNAVFHAYCLMGNHYHLLIETPEANLGRIMRHINGVYTQRYNRLKNTDGPLFRGRYKAILVDSDNYLLPLSRYIHRNPVETGRPLVKHLEEYPWSSYPAFINVSSKPGWLERDQIYSVFGKKQKYQAYRNYVELGVDEELAAFYNKANQAVILGDKRFRQQALRKTKLELPTYKEKRVLVRPTAKQVIAATAEIFEVPESTILTPQKGRQQRNLPRKVAMFLCQRVCDLPLQTVASTFGISHKGGVSNALTEIRRLTSKEKAVEQKVQSIVDMIQ